MVVIHGVILSAYSANKLELDPRPTRAAQDDMSGIHTARLALKNGEIFVTVNKTLPKTPQIVHIRIIRVIGQNLILLDAQRLRDS